MIISAATEDGSKTKIFYADGSLCELPVKEYNTETQEAIVYELDENGLVKTTPWETQDKTMARKILTKTMKLEGTYAEIDGVRV